MFTSSHTGCTDCIINNCLRPNLTYVVFPVDFRQRHPLKAERALGSFDFAWNDKEAIVHVEYLFSVSSMHCCVQTTDRSTMGTPNPLCRLVSCGPCTDRLIDHLLGKGLQRLF